MPVTLKQIAMDLSVSTVTVSRALRNHVDIGPDTRKRVLARAAELGYRPNLTARSLVTGRSSLVGLLVPDLVHPFFAEVARSLAQTLRTQGLYLLICSSEGDPKLQQDQIEHLLSRHLDALVVAFVGQDDSALESITRSECPLILIDREIQIPNAHFVGSDDTKVGFLATQHLIDIGCKRIAHLRGPDNSVGTKRLAGYLKALKKAGLSYVPEYVSHISSGDVASRYQGSSETERLLSLSRRPDGLFCFSDPMAIGAMNVSHSKGLSIPNQLAIIGCGNLHYDDSLRVSLSSIDQNNAKIGQRAASIIFDLLFKTNDLTISDGDSRVQRVVLKPSLIERQSTNRNSKEE